MDDREPESIDIKADPVEAVVCRKCGETVDVRGAAPFTQAACPACGKKLTVPARFGHFLLLQVLGKGGMGAVYKGLDESLNRYVAIKVMQQSLGENDQAVQNFLQEARAAAALNHVNVVQIYSCGQERGQVYIAMELVGGGRLDQIMARDERLTERRILEIAVQIAEGLRAAADAELVHGDIKPANILFGADGNAKVADFGLARFESSGQPSGEIWGTPFYIPPEKVRKHREDHRSDIYSLGATLFHALAGRPPFDGPTARDVVLLRLKEPAPDLGEVRPDLHPQTVQVIARMLEDDPSRRYPTHASLLADLRAALETVVAAEAADARPRKRRTGLVVGLLVLVAALTAAAAGLYLALRPAPPDDDPARDPDPGPANGAVTQAVAAAGSDTNATGTAAAGATESEGPTVHPFKEANDVTVTRLIRELAAAGGGPAAEDQLEKVYRLLPKERIGRHWLRVSQAVFAYAGGRGDDVAAHVKALLETAFEPLDEERPHPGAMPQALARFLTGTLDAEGLQAEAERWPAWFGQVVTLVRGLALLQAKQGEDAEPLLRAYAGAETNEVQWARSFQPLVAPSLEAFDDWQRVEKQARATLAEGKAEEVITSLQEYRKQAPPFLTSGIDTVLAEARKQLNEARRREQEAARLEHEERIQADLALIDALLDKSQVAVARKDFRSADKEARRLERELKTEEGRLALANVRDGFQRLEELKLFLADSVKKQPVPRRADPELAGDVVNATAEGLLVKLAYGDMLKPWDQLPTPSMVRIATYALRARRDLGPGERADRLVSLAYLCYANGAFATASTYAAEAAGLDEGLLPEIRRLMPDILEP